MQKISRRWWGAIALGAVLAFGVTACSTRKGSGMFDWIEGTKPLEERQTIEDYQAAVEVQLGRFVEQLGVESGGTTLLSPSKISSRSNGGYMMFSALSLSHQEGPWTGGDRRGGAGGIGRGRGWCARGPPGIVCSDQ